MALEKNITLPSKAVASYHRIVGLFILDSERICEIHLESWVDEAARLEVETKDGANASKWQPLAKPVAQIRGAMFNQLFGDGVPEYPTKADLYSYLKTEPQFVGAADV